MKRRLADKVAARYRDPPSVMWLHWIAVFAAFCLGLLGLYCRVDAVGVSTLPLGGELSSSLDLSSFPPLFVPTIDIWGSHAASPSLEASLIRSAERHKERRELFQEEEREFDEEEAARNANAKRSKTSPSCEPREPTQHENHRYDPQDWKDSTWYRNYVRNRPSGNDNQYCGAQMVKVG